MLIRTAASAIVTAAVMATPASAGVWSWGCSGQLAGNKVIFNSHELVLVPATSPQGKLSDLGANHMRLDSEDGKSFDATDGSSGFEKTMTFKHNDNSTQQVTLNEVSSRKISERKGYIGPREETTTVFRKTYDYVLGEEPKQRVKMDCVEYMLGTRGGR